MKRFGACIVNRCNILLKRFHDISIKKKLIIAFVLVVFVPVLTVGIILTTGMRDMAIERAINEALRDVEDIERKLESTFKIISDISSRIYLDKDVEAIVTKKYKSHWEVTDAYRDFTTFDEYMEMYKEIESIRLYSENNTLINNLRFMKATENIRSSSWYRNAIKARGMICWEFIENETTGEVGLSLIRHIRNIYDESLGVLVIEIGNEYLFSLMKYQTFDTMVINEQGYIVAAKDMDYVGKKAADLGMEQYMKEESCTIMNAIYRGKPSNLIIKSFVPRKSKSRFVIVSVFPVDSIVAEANHRSIIGFSIMGVSLMVAVILILIFSNALSRRINLLSSEMHKVAMGNLERTVTIEGGDEIGQLSCDLDKMIRSINRLVHEVYEVNRQKDQLTIRQKEAHLKMLASQINPHFLFNALETIRMKAHSRGEKEIAEKVKTLGKIFRISLEVGNELIKLGKEIELVKNYLDIQNFRYGDKIKYEINLNNLSPEYRILPLIIQPIVENAVIHGLENKKGVGKILIDAQQQGDLIRISVIDDGLGMEADKLTHLKESLDCQEGSPGRRIGLRNVHQRIRLLYGEKYGVTIDSQLNRGTRVDILLPKETSGCSSGITDFYMKT